MSASRPGDRLPVELIGREERCDAADEQRFADAAHEAWESDRTTRDRQREQARERCSLGERLDSAVRGLTATSSVSASPLERASKTTGDERDPGPPRCAAPDVSASVTVVTFHVRQLERRLDEERGLVRPGAGGLMGSEEKDKLIWTDFAGVRAEDVAAAAPYLGTSARTIMRAREREAAKRKLKVRLIDGVVLGKVVEGA